MRKPILMAVAMLAVAGCSGGNGASQQAELERLKAETEKLKAEAEQLRQQNAQREAEWEAGAAARETERRLDERYFGKPRKAESDGRAAVENSAAAGAAEGSE